MNLQSSKNAKFDLESADRSKYSSFSMAIAEFMSSFWDRKAENLSWKLNTEVQVCSSFILFSNFVKWWAVIVGSFRWPVFFFSFFS